MLAAVAAIASRSAWWGQIDEPSTWAGSDHQILWSAATALDEQRDPFDAATLDEIGRRAGREVTPFSASQPAAIAAVGWTVDDDHVASYRRWRLVNVVLLVLCVAACAWLVATLGGERAVALAPLPAAVAILGLAESTPLSLWFNSWNPATALLLLVGAVAWRRWPWAAGAALGLAVAAKTSPALVVVLAGVAGAWRVVGGAALAWGGVTALAVATLGVDVHLGWAREILPRLGLAAVSEGAFNNALHTWNLAPNGLVSRAGFVHEDLDTARLVARGVALAVVAVSIGAVVAARRRGRIDGRWLVALGVTTSFLASSVTWPHHLIFGSVAWAWWLADGSRASRAVGLLALVLLVPPQGSWGAEEWDARLRTIGLVALWAAVLCAPPQADERVGLESGSSAPDLPTG